MKSYRYHDYIQQHYQYLRKAVNLIKDFELDGELMALFADPAVLEEISPHKKQLIEAASTILRIDPLHSLAEKSALVQSLDRALRAQKIGSDGKSKVKHSTLPKFAVNWLDETFSPLSFMAMAVVMVFTLCCAYCWLCCANHKPSYSPVTTTVENN